MGIGRPAKDIDVEYALTEMALGRSLREVARELDVSPGTLIARFESSKDLSERYARATYARAVRHADEIIEIADEDVSSPVVDKEGNVVGSAVDKGKVQHQALRVDARKWVASKLIPRYRDKTEIVGADGKDLIPEMAPADVARELAFILAKAAAEKDKDGS
jgi:AcrR family transcriptional regulator